MTKLIPDIILESLGGPEFLIQTRIDNLQTVYDNTGLRFTLRMNKLKCNIGEVQQQEDGNYTIRFIKFTKPGWNHETNTIRPFKKKVVKEIKDVMLCDVKQHLLEYLKI